MGRREGQDFVDLAIEQNLDSQTSNLLAFFSRVDLERDARLPVPRHGGSGGIVGMRRRRYEHQSDQVEAICVLL